jgi:hypothetical protein
MNKPICTITKHGDKEWRLNGKLHREDRPAVEHATGSKAWWLNEWANGSKFWYLNGKFHREDGPAIEWNDGTKSWYLNGRLHRENGPAIERANGSKEWWYHGKKLDCGTQAEFERLMKLKAFW